ncbi:alkaline phosphatase family protein, partial [Acinetobacter baumannii]
NLGTMLSANGVSWGYYGEGWANGAESGENGEYCNICNPFLFSSQIMTNATLRANLFDTSDFFSQVTAGTLPSVSIVKPDGYLDGHAAS